MIGVLFDFFPPRRAMASPMHVCNKPLFMRCAATYHVRSMRLIDTTLLRKIMMVVIIAVVAFATHASAQTIPGVPDTELAKAHIFKGCPLPGVSAGTQKIFGSYALAIRGEGHIPESFFPGGAPATADVGAVWCRFNRAVTETSDFLLVRYQTYSSGYAAKKGFDLAVNTQNEATPNNQYKTSVRGSLTFAVRKYGEVIAVRGSQLASAAWYVPTQQPDYINRKISGAALIPMMFTLLCVQPASSC